MRWCIFVISLIHILHHGLSVLLTLSFHQPSCEFHCKKIMGERAFSYKGFLTKLWNALLFTIRNAPLEHLKKLNHIYLRLFLTNLLFSFISYPFCSLFSFCLFLLWRFGVEKSAL